MCLTYDIVNDTMIYLDAITTLLQWRLLQGHVIMNYIL